MGSRVGGRSHTGVSGKGGHRPETERERKWMGWWGVRKREEGG